MIFYDLEDIVETATIPGLTVITAPDLLKPHLAAGEVCLWIGAPESIDLEGYGQGSCSWKVALIHPEYRDHLAALAALLGYAEDLEPRLSITTIRPDTIDLAGNLYPALELSFETTFRK